MNQERPVPSDRRPRSSPVIALYPYRVGCSSPPSPMLVLLGLAEVISLRLAFAGKGQFSAIG